MRYGKRYSTSEVNLFTANGRERTFEGRWELEENIPASKMAEAGFFRSPEGLMNEISVKDVVICSYCELFIGTWQPTDDPLQEHLK